MPRYKNRNLIIPHASVLVVVFLSTSLTGCSNRSATGISKHVMDSDTVRRPIVLTSVKGVPDGSIITDGDVYQVEESPAWVDKIDKNRTILRSKSEAIGKIARKGLATGDFVYADQLSLPIRPQKGERWLFSFPNNILEKNVGKKIALKGELFQGEDESFRILSYDSIGRIMIIGKIAEGVADHHQCVLATGVLRRVPAVKNAPQLLYGFDAKTVTITPSNW